ncbi:MAG: amidohydrolase [Spirochaetaceae bacterium]|nr:MAG: amidohydrolase [Spirochaetaceae bacterium]
MLRIDCQTHVFPREYAELLTKSSGWLQAKCLDHRYLISYNHIQDYVLDPQTYDINSKIRDMDEAGIDIGILSINIPGPELLPPDLGVEGAKVCNNYIAEVCRQHSDRFFGLASLPLQDLNATIREFGRAIHELDLRGIVLYSHINGKPVDAPEFEPLYDLAEKEQIPLVIHPTVPIWGEVLTDYSMVPMIGFMVDHSIAMLRIILGGVLERHPELLIVHPHCGGVLPYLMPRIEEQTEVKGRGREHITRSPREYYRKVYLDVVSPSAQAIQYAYQFAGADRLLFGSDHPWVKLGVFRDCLDSLGLDSEDAAKIFEKNARRLFKIE